MAEINHLIGIRAPIDKVYAAIATREGLSKWWTATVSGDASVGSVLQFRFGDEGPDMRIDELSTNKRVAWECVRHVPGEWLGTKLSFTLTQENDEVTVRFRHTDWKAVTDFLAFCSEKWAIFLISLKESVETGVGRPYPHDFQIT